MRPDCSVRIRPDGSTPSRVTAQELEVWLHFDAKYRVDNLLAQLSSAPDSDELLAESATTGGAKRDDLLKMHAYRDAISRTAGAYVLYPGVRNQGHSAASGLQRSLARPRRLPPLRPNSEGLPSSSQALDQFFSDVLMHVASQVTRDERHRFWTATVHRSDEPTLKSSLTTDFLDEPPADTDVLLAFVRDVEHLQWIDQLKQYNIRAGDRVGAVEIGGRELGAKLLVLYENRNGLLRVARAAKVARWRPATAADLSAIGYPDPRGEIYFVADIEFIEHLPAWADSIDLEHLTSGVRSGAPIVVTWWDIVRAALPPNSE